MARRIDAAGHGIEFGDDGFVAFRVRGVVSVEAVTVFVREMGAYKESHPSPGLVIDFRGGADIEPEARRSLIDSGVDYPVAVFGGSFATRVLIKVMSNAARILRRSEVRYAVVDSEAEARAWLCEQLAG
ncbi:MAG: STAS/SEC14 domain-containing protein [Myxococcales bacterium]|nr:STAS/SEC14 domain-containing protein [Myxococcales bacterium]